ncbi:tRNA A-37 threonylcarbamoyl transferase component Bud32 [Kitasatospora sp. MAP12-15]|uniref:protein kinase domain-containing protein n=1 Tax=unclassified Kitasatospora TaxID=2633591 RepID=UPI0024732859|nr:protein kinase [Kitasatospora sp. MAP12-44]MDH6111813.1 tRNA A-37 threonylcarbamoyl transferase component Bud32 [Kitasatospora sp. MAP12-44]
MAQTQQPGDGEGDFAPGTGSGQEQDDATHETPRFPDREPGAAGSEETAATRVVGGAAGFDGPPTPSRGTAAPLGTLGDGRYRLTHRLGRGGMAEVLAAQDVRLGRTVAVKLLRAELAQDDVARQRFTREAHSVAGLNHHSIVAVYDTGEDFLGGESTPYIVMELVEGRTVRELLLAEDAPPVDQALIIIAGVLEALDYSHRHGIVHRDIKPANVIITTAGAVKVMDFGIARALTGAASTMTQTGMVMGTPQYLSPEQALGKPVDHRSDLYAAGCMLYELLTLRPPFTGDTPLAVVYQHVQDAPVPPSQMNPRVPQQFDALVLRSLAKSPDDRFQSADEFRAHLQHALREMHGAAGAGGYGGYGGYQGTPADGTAITEAFGMPAGPPDATTVLPYGGAATAAYGTPATPYQGVGGPGDTGHGGGYGQGGYGQGGYGGSGGAGGGDDHEPPRRRRAALAWVVGLLLLVGGGVGIALAVDNGSTKPPAPATSSPTDQLTDQPSETPSVTPSPTPGHSYTPTQSNTNTGQYPPSTGYTRTRTSSPSASASASASASSSASDSASSSASPPPSPPSSNTSSAPPSSQPPPTKASEHPVPGQ